jgi:LAS superfamily LD-carboxypeptidase LdcB
VTPAELTGTSRGHIVDLAHPQCALHGYVVAPFSNLRNAAAADGFDLVPVSSFRDFARQLAIWNRKFERAAPLPPEERIAAILQWSALPGASRHHWGTDLDLIDGKAAASGYRVQLIPDEFVPPGPFAPLAGWLEVNAPRFGFFRPFRGILSGVRSEPWHFSFAPVAERARRELTCEMLREALQAAPLLGKEQVLERLGELHARYVASIDWP